MRPQALKRRAKRMLAHDKTMQPAERAAVERAIKEPALLQKWCDKTNEVCPSPPDYVLYAGGEFMDRLWTWFKENWPTILKLLLSLLVLL